MLVMSDEEVKTWQKLQVSAEDAARALSEEHAAFWRELYPPYRPSLKEKLWDWCSDHQLILQCLVAAVIIAVLVGIVVAKALWVFGLAVILFVFGLVIYIIWCAASGIVQGFLDWLM